MTKEWLPEGTRRCTHCMQILPVERFGKNKNGLQSWCKSCCNAVSRARNKARYHEDKEYRRHILDAKSQTTQAERARVLVARSNEIAQGLHVEFHRDVDDD